MTFNKLTLNKKSEREIEGREIVKMFYFKKRVGNLIKRMFKRMCTSACYSPENAKAMKAF